MFVYPGDIRIQDRFDYVVIIYQSTITKCMGIHKKHISNSQTSLIVSVLIPLNAYFKLIYFLKYQCINIKQDKKNCLKEI
jgi:hypothetical protein